MKRETDLGSYLPPFLAEYEELHTALEAENPEFDMVLKTAEGILKNEFIETADETGIQHFEKLLGILPAEEDTLEERRTLVQAKWISKLPYTVRMLAKKLTALCGGDDFQISKRFEAYTIRITTHLRLYSQVQELQSLLERMVPVNMLVEVFNSIRVASDGVATLYVGVRHVGKHKIIRTEVKNYGME